MIGVGGPSKSQANPYPKAAQHLSASEGLDKSYPVLQQGWHKAWGCLWGRVPSS